MKLLFRKSISYVFIIIVLGLALYYLIQNWESVKSINWWENPGFLSIHILLLVIILFLSVIGWHRLLIATGSNVGIKVSGYTWLTSNIGKYIPGKVFMVAGRIALLNFFGVRKSIVIGNIIWEHVFVILAIMPFIFVILLNYAGYLSIKMIVTSMCFFILILSVILNPIIIQKSINLVLRIVKKPPLELSLKLHNILYFFFFYLIIWVVYGLTGVTLAFAFGFETKVSMMLFFNVYIFSWFIGFISVVTPGGLGVREGILILPRISGHIEKPQVKRGNTGGCVHETEPKEIRYSI